MRLKSRTQEIGIGLFLIAGMLLASGMERVVWSAAPPHYVVWAEPIGWLELGLAAMILLYTAGAWSQLLAGYMLIGAGKSLIVLIIGHDLFAPYGPFPRAAAAGLTLYCAATVVLLFRFAKTSPTILDRVALTIYVFSFMWGANSIEFSALGPGLAVGFLAMLLAWSVHEWRTRGHSSAV